MNSEYFLPAVYRAMQILPVACLVLAALLALSVCVILVVKPVLRRRQWVMGYNSIAEQLRPGYAAKSIAAPPAPEHLKPVMKLCFVNGQLAALHQLQKLKEQQQRKITKRRKRAKSRK